MVAKRLPTSLTSEEKTRVQTATCKICFLGLWSFRENYSPKKIFSVT